MMDKEDLINYYDAYDLDWYMTTNQGYICHFSSSGGKFPKIVLEDLEDLEKLNSFFKNLPNSSFSKVNPFLNDFKPIKSKNELDKYIKYNSTWSDKGLFSFDKTDLAKPIDCNYHLTTYPDKALKFDELTFEIKQILKKMKVSLNLNNLWCIELSSFFEM